MPLELKCFIDMDGVIVDFMPAMRRHLKIPESYQIEKGNFDTIGPMCEFAGWDEQKMWEELSTDFWSELPWTPEGKDILSRCEAVYGQDNCYILSSDFNPVSAYGKRLWLKKHLRHYRKRALLGSGKDACAFPTTTLVDDGDHNIDAFTKAGGRGILYARPWNSSHECCKEAFEMFSIQIVKSWSLANEWKNF
jgi:hypothetical protein